VTGFAVEKLDWSDEELGSIELPKGRMQIRAGFGSGLAVRKGDPPGVLWAIGDRGPNLKIKMAVERYGLSRIQAADGAKIMPRLDLGPALAQLRITGSKVELLRMLRITGADGEPVSGLPVPEGGHAECEPALSLDGDLLAPDPSGLDTEGVAALADGGFWVGDEFGPSLVRLNGDGRVLRRLVPEGVVLEGATYPIEASLPAIAARRQLNRGFEAIALSADETWLFLAFQSPLAHPDEKAHEAGRHVRLWRLDAASGEVAAQYLYPLDPPRSFRRDNEKGTLEWKDLKVSELLCPSDDALLVLERGSETTKIYRTTITPEAELAAKHLDIDTRPTLEELSARGELDVPVLGKELVFSSDDAPQVAADLEGMAILSPWELLLVNDNDFGVEGAETSFWRISFDRPLLA
jgi:Esterase-like activity of phytase